MGGRQQAEWFKFPVTDDSRFACLNWLPLVQYGWKGNGNPTWLSQSASFEVLISDFGCLPQLIDEDTGHQFY